jgi:two-component sensor histidine kinase
VLRATFGTRVEEMTGRPRMRPGEGITGNAAAARAPVMIPAQAHLDDRFKAFPNLPEDEYESILAVPILARETLEGALNVRTRAPREFTPAEIDLLVAIASQVGQTIEHAKLYAQAQRRVVELEALARISEAVSESLYLEESLEGIVEATVDALVATGAAVALEHGRAVLRGVLAQEIHHRVKNNLQTVASLLRLQARADGVDASKALDDSVNRILAIAAVHEVLTERRDDDVELDDLLDRLRAMLVQGLGASKEVEASLEPVALAGNRATALALVFSELLQNALEHGGHSVRVELARRDGEVVLAIADDGSGVEGEPVSGTGLSIVRALVRDELGGTLSLESNGGLRAEVVFPA